MARPESNPIDPQATDVNLAVAGLLYDMAALHGRDRRAFAYRRSAATVLALEEPVSTVAAEGRLRAIPNIGPSTERIVREYLAEGGSSLVEKAVRERGAGPAVASLRALRSNYLSRAAAEMVLAAPLAGVVGLAEHRADFQMHSEWSDGADSLDAMVESAAAFGHTAAAVTDHSYGLRVARGMSMDAAARQHEAIDRINHARRGGFRLFKGIEANITAEGGLDLDEAERRRFELVVAAPHSGLRGGRDQTARMEAAVTARGVHVLGHPRGRRFNVRPGIAADWGRVFRAAAACGTAVEIDGFPERQDLDAVLASEALAAGCLFALDSDAHSAAELRYSRVAVAHARLAGIPAARVVNCWSADRILEWAENAWSR